MPETPIHDDQIDPLLYRRTQLLDPAERPRAVVGTLDRKNVEQRA